MLNTNGSNGTCLLIALFFLGSLNGCGRSSDFAPAGWANDSNLPVWSGFFKLGKLGVSYDPDSALACYDAKKLKDLPIGLAAMFQATAVPGRWAPAEASELWCYAKLKSPRANTDVSYALHMQPSGEFRLVWIYPDGVQQGRTGSCSGKLISLPQQGPAVWDPIRKTLIGQQWKYKGGATVSCDLVAADGKSLQTTDAVRLEFNWGREYAWYSMSPAWRVEFTSLPFGAGPFFRMPVTTDEIAADSAARDELTSRRDFPEMYGGH